MRTQMKKLYQRPETLVIAMSQSGILAGSGLYNDGEKVIEDGPNTDPDEGDGDDANSKRESFSLWDDASWGRVRW